MVVYSFKSLACWGDRLRPKSAETADGAGLRRNGATIRRPVLCPAAEVLGRSIAACRGSSAFDTFDFRQAEAAELRATKADVGQPDEGLAIRRQLSDEPCGGTGWIKQFDDRDRTVSIAPLALMCKGREDVAGSGSCRDLLVFVLRIDARTKAQKKIRRLAGLQCGAENGAVVFAQHVEPNAEIVGVTDGRHDAEAGADKGARHFRDQFLARVAL